jgi:type VI secretion system secreted protein VgrG
MGLVNQRSVLMEGISDDKGNVKLTAEQEKQLAKEFSERPANIWMMYPGQAVQLEVHQEQPDWTDEQKALYALSAMDYSDDLHTSKYGEEAAHDRKRGLKDMLLSSGNELYKKLKQ